MLDAYSERREKAKLVYNILRISKKLSLQLIVSQEGNNSM